MDVYRTPAASLDALVVGSLQLPAEFVGTTRRALGTLETALRECGSRPGPGAAAPPWRVLKTAKGGSFGRGTALRGGCDSEIVVFLNCFKSYEDQRARRAETLTEMRALLESWRQSPVPGLSLEFLQQDTPGVLQFRLASADLENWMDVSLAPAFDALGQLSSGTKPDPQIYSTLLDSGCQDGEHAACFAELRRNFTNTRPTKLKNLILLVKHWYRQVCPQERRREMPPDYALELLTIFAWEKGCGKDAFSLAQGLRTVLGLIQQHQHLRVFWTTNYGFEDPAVKKFLLRQLDRPRPVILDPADPSWDVGNGAAWHWDLLAREAESCYDSPCFLQAAGGAVQPWEVPGLPLTAPPILRDPAQKTPEDSSSLDAVHPRAGNGQPSCPDPDPSVVAAIAPCALEVVSDLSQIPARELDRFIQDHLKPQPQFQKQVSKAFDVILSCLRENGAHKASRVSKGGSFGRGTDLRGGCDAELIVFLNCFKNYKDQGPLCAEVLRDLRAQLESCGQEPVPGLTLKFAAQTTTKALRFQLVSSALKSWMDVSLLPVFDAVGQLSSGTKPDPQIYSTLLDSGCQDGEHAACFAELRRNFVNSRPVKLKNLILLVKHWYRQVCPQERRREMPPDYALELLTIFAWEKGCGKDAFSLAQGLRTVLGLIQQHQHLRVFWTTNYGFEDPAVKKFLLRQLDRPRPVILDPADPTWDVGNGAAWHWDLLAREAESCYDSPCFLQAAGGAVQPWEVPGLPLAAPPILRDPAQKTPEDSSSLDAVHPRAGNGQPSCPDPDPSVVAAIAPCALEVVSDLSQIPARELDRFIQDHLKPQPQFQKQVSKAFDVILSCLRENGAHKASRVSKGGSFGRGTDLRGGCDAELIVFLNCFKNYKDQGPLCAEVLRDLRAQLESCGQEPVPGLTLKFAAQTTTKALRFQLVSSALKSWMDVSLLPVFDAVGQLSSGTKPDPQIYSTLLDSGCQDGEHAACFAELRRNFVNSRPVKLKNLILLVKHWYRQVCPQERRREMPPDYALELLTIFAWEKGCGKDAFSLAQGLRTVLSLIQQHQHLRVFWTTNYGFEDPAVKKFLLRQLDRPRPVILDPADPTWDVGNGAAWHWDLLAREAESCYDSPCFLQAAGGAVQPWEVPGLPLTAPPILRDPAQKTPEDSSSLDAVHPRAGNGQPSCPDPDPSVVAAIAPCALEVVSDLSQIPARELDRFIQDHLKPQPQFQKQVSKAFDVILSCLRENGAHKASRVSKGGSFGRGTDLRGGCDAELIVFLNCFKNYKDQGPLCAEVLRDLRAQLESCGQEPVPGLTLKFAAQTTTKALRFQLVSSALKSWVDVSLLPVFDAVGQLSSGTKPDPQIYSTLLDSGCQDGEHAACFAELRRNFVNSRPVKLKNLILLVKHWYRQVAAQNEGGRPACASLPPAFALELLTIFAWEQGCGKDRFSMAEGLRTVLRLVQQHQQLSVFWTVNYSFEDPALRTHLLGQLRKPRPLILDPADPTWNVGQGSWELLAREAAALETQACVMSREGTPVPPWDVMPTLLRQTPASDLDKFISALLQPNQQFLDQVAKAVDTICSFLRENCFRNSPTKVLKVVKGGSSAKGTALQGRSDADLVVFLTCFSQFTEQGSNRAEIISEIRAQLEACKQELQFDVKFEISKWENPRVLSFSLTSPTMLDQSVDFDVLPAFDALGQLGSGSKPPAHVYVDLIRSYNNAGEYACCFTELQRDFIVSRPTKLKSLIRLVKHWYQQCNKMPKGKGSLPPQHGLELLTVYAWEQGGQDPQFNMAQGFRTVLELVTQYRQLCVYWTVNYSWEDESIKDFLKLQLQKPRPIILDPADPTGNLGHNARWDLLAREAAAYISALCCMDKDGTPVQPWPVKAAV
uniref:2'-5'-oligoadenylate synthase 3 n=1 Tax=Molossus molossus TaxID=27622 RepID=A0A7J8BYZ0_MOLMO|nr:2'-5'-oligoadenylate synthetase 3 [Molossus molossus]